MKAITTTFQFNKVCVIQSLATDEPQTGERLVNDRLRPALTPMGFRTSYVKVADRVGFFQAMADIWASCARDQAPRTYPIIHLDTHGFGDRSGIALLPSREKVTWTEFAESCKQINRECHNNVLVASAMCHGLHSITGVSIRDSAPFLGLVGPQETVTANAIDAGFDKFYEKVLESGDLVAAMAVIGSEFSLFQADRLFVNAFRDYIAKSCKGIGQVQRVERLLAEWMETKAEQRMDTDTARQILMDYTAPNRDAFERFKRRFLMSDHPDNAGRFDDISFELVYDASNRSI